MVTSDTTGTDTGGVYANFAGDFGNQPSHATGDLNVGQVATATGGVSGTATFGGTATLMATLTSSATGAGVPGQTVNFTLDGTSVGFATTDSNGVATLTGVATTEGAGTDTGGVGASFAGTTSFAAAANATGNLVVSQAASSLGSVGEPPASAAPRR